MSEGHTHRRAPHQGHAHDHLLAIGLALVALTGLAVNAGGAAILARSGRESLNFEAAFRHVIADPLGSVGVSSRRS